MPYALNTSLNQVPSSIQHVEEDEEHKTTAENLRKMGQERLTLEERKKRRRALDALGVPSFKEFLTQQGVELVKRDIEILQLNIGLYCNQAQTLTLNPKPNIGLYCSQAQTLTLNQILDFTGTRHA
jgi:hypothetical protein